MTVSLSSKMTIQNYLIHKSLKTVKKGGKRELKRKLISRIKLSSYSWYIKSVLTKAIVSGGENAFEPFGGEKINIWWANKKTQNSIKLFNKHFNKDNEHFALKLQKLINKIKRDEI